LPSTTLAEFAGLDYRFCQGECSMKTKRRLLAAAMLAAVLAAAAWAATVRARPQAADTELLQVRERVWRAWFAGDIQTLEQLVPPDTIVMSGGEEQWKHQAEVLRTAAEFHAKGGKLLRLEFPRTEVQHYGDVAIVWSSYALELEVDGKKSSGSSRVTEIFVKRNGKWTNPGWHTDEEK
jgi:ketosteroid isomerase-like protein